jgi:hypothetical protein
LKAHHTLLLAAKPVLLRVPFDLLSQNYRIRAGEKPETVYADALEMPGNLLLSMDKCFNLFYTDLSHRQ